MLQIHLIGSKQCWLIKFPSHWNLHCFHTFALISKNSVESDAWIARIQMCCSAVLDGSWDINVWTNNTSLQRLWNWMRKQLPEVWFSKLIRRKKNIYDTVRRWIYITEAFAWAYCKPFVSRLVAPICRSSHFLQSSHIQSFHTLERVNGQMYFIHRDFPCSYLTSILPVFRALLAHLKCLYCAHVKWEIIWWRCGHEWRGWIRFISALAFSAEFQMDAGYRTRYTTVHSIR